MKESICKPATDCRKDKVHILGFNKFKKHKSITRLEFRPPKGNKPDGMIWHAILGKFVPESWKDKEMWVDRSETIFAVKKGMVNSGKER